ncbi:MAG: hypothetical protein OES25_00240 [Acidobacteriota bacterium]|nr:hypothetical protein [Acidobacteriota bacterium]
MFEMRRWIGWAHLRRWIGATSELRSVTRRKPTDLKHDEPVERFDAVARSASKSLECWERSRPDLFGKSTDATDHATLDAARRRRQARSGGSAA